MPIEVTDDGFEEVTVKTADGGGKTVKLDVYVVGYECKKVYADWEAAGKPAGEFTPQLVAVFDKHDLPGLSGKAATDLACKLMEAMGAGVGKSEATPPPG